MKLLLSIMLISSLFISGSVPNNSDKVIVCLSKTAYAYHAKVCKGLDRCTHGTKTITLTQAIEKNYKPCKICY